MISSTYSMQHGIGIVSFVLRIYNRKRPSSSRMVAYYWMILRGNFHQVRLPSQYYFGDAIIDGWVKSSGVCHISLLYN